MSKKTARLAAIAAGVFIFSSIASPPAFADSNPDETAAAAVLSASSDLTTELTRVSTQTLGGAETSVNDVDLSITTNPDQGISLTSSSGVEVQVEIPEAAEAVDGRITGAGLVAYDHGSDYSTIVASRSDGSLQINTVIKGSDSPTSYSYPISTAGGGKLEKSGKAVFILDANGAFAGAVAPAWATDANGADVPTHFEVDGETLTQVVDHTDGNYAYPIVADPWVGINLFDTVVRHNYSGWYKISAALSAWGRTIHTSGYLGTSGIAIMQTAGWSEVKSRQPSVNTTSMLQQYLCHTIGGLFEWDTWDFESNRPANANFAQWVGSRCNW